MTAVQEAERMVVAILAAFATGLAVIAIAAIVALARAEEDIIACAEWSVTKSDINDLYPTQGVSK